RFESLIFSLRFCRSQQRNFMSPTTTNSSARLCDSKSERKGVNLNRALVGPVRRGRSSVAVFLLFISIVVVIFLLFLFLTLIFLVFIFFALVFLLLGLFVLAAAAFTFLLADTELAVPVHLLFLV